MIIDFLLAAIGMTILLLSGDVLVKGAVNLSLRLGVPALLISLTIVAFGTSAPELLISVTAVLDGVPGLALGNVVGSNIANTLLILGIPALIFCFNAAESGGRDFLIMMAATILFIGLAFVGPFQWWHGLILLAALAGMLLSAARDAQNHRKSNGHGGDAPPEEALDEADPDLSNRKIWLLILLGLVGLPIGSNILIDSAVDLSRALGVSDTVIGLTLVAVGTSLPELATTLAAAKRQHADVAFGNVIGSNMFNLLGIIGIACIVGPIPVEQEMLTFDLWVMLAASAMLTPFVLMKRQMRRLEGALLLSFYVLFVVLVLA